ncbi:9498_t:CDS:2, partial [Ambispora gerdemannii]
AKIQEARSRGIAVSEKEPPQHWEDICEDVENISLLINFLEWIVTEEEKLLREEEVAQKKAQNERLNDIISRILDSKLEESSNRRKELDKEIEEHNKQIEKLKSIEDKENRRIEKRIKQIERLKNGEDIDSDEDVESEDEFLLEEENEVKNILLIGRTGSGKSTLANVLVNKNKEFEPVFKESARSVSETKNIQTEKFTVDLSRDRTQNISYLVIDTAGFGDTQLDNKEILNLLKGLVPIIKENGLNQIFFVTNGRFTQQEVETYKLLESVIFDREAVNYTTIIRTSFDDFEDRKACEDDEQNLREENQEIFKILKSSKIIYINNPPLIGRSAVINKEVRKESRKRLLTHLGACGDNYYPVNLEDLNKRINDYITSEEELKRKIALKEQKNQEEQTEHQKEIESIRAQKERELKIAERNFERKIQELKNQNQKKIQATRQEFETAHQSQLQKSREVHDKEVNEVKQAIQNNLSKIRNSYSYVKVGKPVCRYGHDRDIRAYDKSGSFIPDQSNFIDYIYCPTCGTNDCNFTLQDAKIYSLEELSRKNSQHAEERKRKMQEAIDEQNKKEQEIINRINQEKTNRDAETIQNIQERERLEHQVINQQKKLNEERLRQEKLVKENKINSTSQDRENELKRELEQKKQALEDHIIQSETQRNNALQELYVYIEQRRS